MYRKIICKNGKIVLVSNIEEKITEFNDHNIIEIANIDNKLEELECQKEEYLDSVKLYTKRIKKNKLLGIFATIISGFLSLNFLFFGLNILLLVVFYLSTVYLISFCNNMYKKEIDSNNMVIDFIERYNTELLSEKEKLFNKPTFNLIREGQNFKLKDTVYLKNALKLLCSYYKYKTMVHRLFNNSSNLYQDIQEKFSNVFIECEVDPYNQDLVVNEVYNNIIKEKKLIKK